MQHIRKKLVGKLFLSILLIGLLLLCGCSLDESDDLYYALPNGYFVSRINSKQIAISWDKNWESNPDSMCGVTAIKKYFVKGFCYNERYIGLYGTHTQLDYATDDEIKAGTIHYYLIDTKSRVVYGPFSEPSDYTKVLEENECEDICEWFETKEYPTQWRNHYRAQNIG